MNPRARRLTADQAALVQAFSGHPAIEVTSLSPAPSDRYRVIYRVPALRRNDQNALEVVSMVVVELSLPAGYPREKPYCTTSTPIFHPNFGNYICIADTWSPSMTIVDTIVEIGDMLQYKLYNTGSPLNALAAKWVVDNLEKVPLSNVELIPLEPEISLGATSHSEGVTSVNGAEIGSFFPLHNQNESVETEEGNTQ